MNGKERKLPEHYPLGVSDPITAAGIDFLRTGATIEEDTEDRLILVRNGLYYGFGHCERSASFRSALMALCFDPVSADIMIADGCFDDRTECDQFVYTDAAVTVPEQTGIELRPLTRDHVPFLLQHYDHPSATERHMKERIDAGMLGAFCGDVCAGFVGQNDEGTIGMLTVLPEYRRRGIARLLESTVIEQLLSAGRIPYTHVKLGNSASAELQLSLGLKRSAHPVIWLCKDAAYHAAKLE